MSKSIQVMHYLMLRQTGFTAILTNPPIRAGKETVFSFYEGAFSKLRVGWRVVGCNSEKTRGAFND